MRYINKKDERVIVQEESCACGHSPEEHHERTGGCHAVDEETGERCECEAYRAEQESLPALAL